MRVAKKLEKETGKKIIHFEKGDYQGPDFETPQHILDATVHALESGYVRYDPVSYTHLTLPTNREV